MYLEGQFLLYPRPRSLILLRPLQEALNRGGDGYQLPSSNFGRPETLELPQEVACAVSSTELHYGTGGFRLLQHVGANWAHEVSMC